MSGKRDSPFSTLEALRDTLPPGKVPQAQADKPDKAAKGPARAVVRLERKQRRGKEVTVVDKLGLAPEALEQWCRELKQACGCGGTVEGEMIVLQGDLRTRLPDLLTARGVAKVTIG